MSDTVLRPTVTPGYTGVDTSKQRPWAPFLRWETALVVAAVVVGGVAIFGGSGTVFGAALAALLLNTINQGLVSSRISSFWTDAIAGALLLGAIAFDRWLSLRVARSLQSAEGAHRDV